MTHIDYTESPYFYTMADIFVDWTPEHVNSPFASEYLPAIEQCNRRTKSVYDLKGRPVLRVVDTQRETLIDRILR